MILNALQGKSLPVYGNGQQIRDWLFVEDHARALYTVVTQGTVSETYNIGDITKKLILMLYMQFVIYLKNLHHINRKV